MLGFAVHKITEKIRGVVAKARRDNSTFGVTWRTTMRSTVLRCLAFATIFGLQLLSTNVSALPVGLTWKDTQPAGDKTTGLAAASSSSQSHGPYTVADKAFGMYGAIFQDPVLGRVGRLEFSDDPVIAALPIPGTAWLVGVGFAGLIVARRFARQHS
jgi:hypothetical protein